MGHFRGCLNDKEILLLSMGDLPFSNRSRGGEDGGVGVDQRGLGKHLAGEEGKETAVRM